MNLPAFTSLATNWIPKQEKSFLFAVCLAGILKVFYKTKTYIEYIFFFLIGGEAGTVVCLIISGILASNYGWEFSFYVWGGCGILWFIFWITFVYETPDDHPTISKYERIFINSNVQKSQLPSASHGSKLPRAPLLKIITSVPVIATILTALGQNYGFYTILKMTPTYLNNIQHVSIENVSKQSDICF